MQGSTACTPELRPEESHLLWVCAGRGGQLSPLLAPALRTWKGGFPSAMVNEIIPCPCLGVLSKEGTMVR